MTAGHVPFVDKLTTLNRWTMHGVNFKHIMKLHVALPKRWTIMRKTMCHHFRGIWLFCDVSRYLKFALRESIVRFDFSIFSGGCYTPKSGSSWCFEIYIRSLGFIRSLGLGQIPSFIYQTSFNKWVEWMLLGSFGSKFGAFFFATSPWCSLLIVVISLFLIWRFPKTWGYPKWLV